MNVKILNEILKFDTASMDFGTFKSYICEAGQNDAKHPKINRGQRHTKGMDEVWIVYEKSM